MNPGVIGVSEIPPDVKHFGVNTMISTKNRTVFRETLFPDGKRRWGSFSVGFGLECVALAVVVILPLLMPQKFEAVQHYWVMPLEAPVVQAWKPQPPPKPVVVKREVVKQLPKPEPVELRSRRYTILSLPRR